ncbi:MAG: creatininase family protein [Firmicutes bacterium]|nr:creatininase family protein [Bacillota bacterium]
MRTHNWLDMYPDEYFDEKKKNPVCYMAYGPAEPHGVYNAMGVDFYNSYLLACRAAEAHGGIVAPPSAWHIQEQPYYDWEMDCCGMGLSLTTSVTEELFLHNLLYHIRNIDAKGFHAGILLSGHYLGGLNEDMRMLCEYYRRKTGSPIQLWAGYVNELDYDFLGKLNLPGSAEDHAGILETVMVMELKPESVNLEKIRQPLNVERRIAGNSNDYGLYCCPATLEQDLPYMTRDLGRRVVNRFVECLGDLQQSLREQYTDRPRRYITMTETEEIWASFCYLTKRYWKCVQSRYEAEHDIYLKFPGFDELEGKAWAPAEIF